MTMGLVKSGRAICRGIATPFTAASVLNLFHAPDPREARDL
jgi:hypothetical protein